MGSTSAVKGKVIHNQGIIIMTPKARISQCLLCVTIIGYGIIVNTSFPKKVSILSSFRSIITAKESPNKDWARSWLVIITVNLVGDN